MCSRLALSAVLLVASQAAAGPLDKPAFTATPDELLAEAKTAGGDEPTVYLLDDMRIAYDDAGRETVTYHTIAIFRDAVSAPNEAGAEWSPAYQDKGKVRVRVIAPDKSVRELDPSLQSESPVAEFAERVHLDVPLPKIAAGSVMEMETVYSDREPVAGGKARVDHVPSSEPVRHATVTVSAPTKLGAKVVARGFAKAPQPKHTSQNGRETWVFALGAFAPAVYENELPGDAISAPYIGVGTGASWAATAAAYATRVDAQLAAGPIALPADVHAATAVADALAFVRAKVKSSKIDLAIAAPLPRPPAETLKRALGDDHDLALLLVAVLRAANVQADLALLDTGPGPDVDRDLVGMGRFDHAIVRARVGGKDVWIDPSSNALPAGQLASRDQGRWALIIASDTRDLVMTPAATSADNAITEVRTFHLRENDHPTVTWTRVEGGVFTNGYRTWLATKGRKDIESWLSREADRMFGGKLGKYGTDATHDFVADITDAKRGGSHDGKSVDLYANPHDTFEHLPDALMNDDEADAVAGRHGDYQFFQPYKMTIENRIVVPTGFTMLAPSRTSRSLGALTLVTDERIDGDAFVVSYTLDTGKARISAKELQATRAAIKEELAKDDDHFVFPLTSAELERNGKIHDAIVEVQRMIAAHPKEASHHELLAKLYLRVGMGAAARREATKATQVEPKSASAFATLGWVLERDTLGQYRGFDADRAGAIAAYRKVLQIDPKHFVVLQALAELYSTDEHGRATVVKTDRAEAIKLWRIAAEQSKTHEVDRRLVLDLLRDGDLVGADAAAAKLGTSRDQRGTKLAATTLARGVAAATTEADALPTDEREPAVSAAAALLLSLRHYDEARGLMHGTPSSSLPMFGPLLDTIQQVNPSKLDQADPSVATRAVFHFVLSPFKDAPWDAELSKNLEEQRGAASNDTNVSVLSKLDDGVLGDISALMTTTVAGNAADGWRVEIAQGGNMFVVYVMLERGRATVIGLPSEPRSIGRYLRRALAAKDLAHATVVFDWFIKDAGSGLGQLGKLMTDERAKTGATVSAELADELAAGLLLKSDPARTASVFHACAVGDKAICRSMELSGLTFAHRWSDAIALSRALLDEKPGDLATTLLHANVLAGAGHIEAAAAVLDEALAKTPDARLLLHFRLQIAAESHDIDAVHKWSDRLVGSADADLVDFNDAAWARLYVDTDQEVARGLTKRIESSVTKKNPLTPMVANTIAAVAAESDDVVAAYKYTLQSVAGGSPKSPDWYVLGRIAETCGLRDDAIAAYKRATPDPRRAIFSLGAYDLAQRNLKRL